MKITNGNVEVTQLTFSPNTIHQYSCPQWIVALLKDLAKELDRVMWNIYQDEYDNPFENTGNSYIGECFEVHAYNWNEDIEQEYNFRYKNIKISWYKYLGRDTTINDKYMNTEIIDMYNNCLKEILNLDIDN